MEFGTAHAADKAFVCFLPCFSWHFRSISLFKDLLLSCNDDDIQYLSCFGEENEREKMYQDIHLQHDRGTVCTLIERPLLTQVDTNLNETIREHSEDKANKIAALGNTTFIECGLPC